MQGLCYPQAREPEEVVVRVSPKSEGLRTRGSSRSRGNRDLFLLNTPYVTYDLPISINPSNHTSCTFGPIGIRPSMQGTGRASGSQGVNIYMGQEG